MRLDQNPKEQAPGDRVISARTMKIGVFLVVLSCILYGGLLFVPFTPFSFRTKAIISSTLIISGELSFWIGGLLLGKEIIAKYKKYLNPLQWFNKKKSD